MYPNGLVPPILNVDGSVNRGYGSDIEYDAQGEFVGVAADVYRISKDPAFLKAVFEPVVRATRFIDTLCAKVDAHYGLDTRFHGLVAPSISHEGYNKPSFSFFDDYFALSAFRNCAFLAAEVGDSEVSAYAKARGEAFAASLERSIRMTADLMDTDLVPGSADRMDVDPTATAIAFEPARVEDVLPSDLIKPTYDRAAARVTQILSPDFKSNYSPYDIRNLNAFVTLKRYDDAFRLLALVMSGLRPAGFRGWAEVVWTDERAPDYVGDMPHTWIGAEFATAVRRMLVRENGRVLELFRAVPDRWWNHGGIELNRLPTAFGALDLKAHRHGNSVSIVMALAGPDPDAVTFRYPGASKAQADGRLCPISGDVVSAPPFKRLDVEF